MHVDDRAVGAEQVAIAPCQQVDMWAVVGILGGQGSRQEVDWRVS